MDEADDFFVIVDAKGDRLLLIRTDPPQLDVVSLGEARRALHGLAARGGSLPADVLGLGFALARTPEEDQAAIREAMGLLDGGAVTTGHVALSSGEPLTLHVSRRTR